jgi:hypothetical protein
MWRQLMQRFFGPSSKPIPVAVTHDDASLTVLDGRAVQKPWRTVGLTEQRLRAANKRSWQTSAKGWSELLGRFSR